MSFQKTAGIAAALMLSGSFAAQAAVLTSTSKAVAVESFDGAVVTPIGGTVPSVTLTRQVSFSGQTQKVEFTLTNAKFGAAVNAAMLAGSGCGGGWAPSVVVTGGAVDSTTVTFSFDSAQACTAITFNPPALKAATGQTIALAATLKDLNGANVDSGVTPAGATDGQLVTFVDGLKGAAETFASSTINLSKANKELVASGSTTTTTFLTSRVSASDTVSFLTDLTTQFNGSFPGATGKLVITGAPTAANAATFKLSTTAASAAADHGGGAVGTCSVASGTWTCSMTTGNLQNLVANGTKGATVQFTVDGTTVITPSTLNATLSVTNVSGNPSATDTLFASKTIASLGNNACAAEFGSMMGKNTPSALTTIRLSNTSATAGKVYVTATDDKGTHSAVAQITKVNGGASANNVLDASDLLPAGATVELLGTSIEAATLGFDSWSGTTRGRVRVFLEASPTSSGQSLGNKGCLAEAWMCINGTCSIVGQTGDGVDNTVVGAQKN